MNQAKINFSIETVVIPENDFGKNLIFRNISVFPVARIKRGVAVVAHHKIVAFRDNIRFLSVQEASPEYGLPSQGAL